MTIEGQRSLDPRPRSATLDARAREESSSRFAQPTPLLLKDGTPQRTLEGVQWLRALAALSVVIYHASARRGEALEVGQAGVDVFFVISGFLMWVITSREAGPVGFMRHRVTRIVPLYWLATAIMVAGGVLGLFPHLVVQPGAVLKSLFFIPYSGDGLHSWPILVQGWTLDYEMAFYAIFAVLLVLRRRWQLVMLAAILGAVAAAGIVSQPQDLAMRFYADPIILEFLAGVLLGWAYLAKARWSRRVGWAAVGAGLLLFGFAAPLHTLQFRALAYGLPALFLVGGVICLERCAVRFAVPLFSYVGSASYSIYLFHAMAISVAVRLIPDIGGPLGIVVTAIPAVIVGCLVYEVAEKPLAARLRLSGPEPSPSLRHSTRA